MRTYPYRNLSVFFAAFVLSGCFSASSYVENADEPVSEWFAAPETEIAEEVPIDFFEDVELPNADRTNPFARSEVPAEASGDSVRLKGFVEVEKPKAILLVDNVLTVMSARETSHGIRVVEIRPPLIVYEQNGVQYSLSLLSM